MSKADLKQLELLASLDRLRQRVSLWSSAEVAWEPGRHCQALMQLILQRVESLQIRYEAPLVVATFGGTGTGKSSLVNALVGEDVTPAGRQRPTTRKPKLIVHSDTELKLLNLPLDEVEVVQRDSEVLSDIIILDCPDPDTNEDGDSGTNLDRLRKLLPFCDVMLVVSTQQKYRSACVADELLVAAAGCRLLFVQTHADLDEDIRDDWRSTLDQQIQIPDMYFVDSQKALEEQSNANPLTGDFAQLFDLLTKELGASERIRIRRANIVDLIQGGLQRCEQTLQVAIPNLKSLECALNGQREQLSRRMAERLQQELLGSHGLWERRLLSALTEQWGVSPFSACLRLYNGFGGLLASLTLFRARSTAQLALLGTVQGKRWLDHLRSEQRTDETLHRVSSFGLDDALLREAEIVISGHAQQAGLNASDLHFNSLKTLRDSAASVEGQFVTDASQQIDQSIEQLARRNSRIVVRAWYELLFAIYLLFILYRVGRNFFYESFVLDHPLLASDFYLAAGLFLILWSGLLVIAFTRRLRRGMKAEVDSLVSSMVDRKLESGLFPELEARLSQLRRWTQESGQMLYEVNRLRDEIAVSPHLAAKTLKADDGA